MASDDRQERARRPNSNCATNKTACTTDIRPYTGNGFAGTTVNVNDGASFVNGDAAQVFYGTNAGLFKITY